MSSLPAAFEDCRSRWTVSLMERYPSRGTSPNSDTITVIADSEMEALLLGRRHGWKVLGAKEQRGTVILPICSLCASAISGSTASKLCRSCVSKKRERDLKKTKAALPRPCSACNVTSTPIVKGLCCSCYQRNDEMRRERRRLEVASCSNCHAAPAAPRSKKGLCKTCLRAASAPPSCVKCGKAPKAANSRKGLCTRCNLTHYTPAPMKICLTQGCTKRHGSRSDYCARCREKREQINYAGVDIQWPVESAS